MLQDIAAHFADRRVVVTIFNVFALTSLDRWLGYSVSCLVLSCAAAAVGRLVAMQKEPNLWDVHSQR